MKQQCDCGDEGCKGHTFPRDRWFLRLHIKDRLWFLFWGVLSIALMKVIVLLSDVHPIPLDKYLIGFVVGCVVTGVLTLRFDDDN